MSDTILVINAGSSSIKFYLYDIDDKHELAPRLGGQLEGIGTSHPKLRVRDAAGKTLVERDIAPSHAPDVPNGQEVVGTWLSGHLGGAPLAVGHRVVHGGPDLSEPVLIDDAILAKLDTFTPLAPLHQPNNLAPIRVIRERRPWIPQVACFDTAFHRSHSDVADRYALPESLYQEGVRRYGFHGLSYEYIAQRLRQALPELAMGKIIAAHLGSGVSACAMHEGKSVDSTMGFTALEGLPMGTRPGRLDPGVVLWMMERGMDHDQIEHLLYHDCGMKGLSGISNDMRELLASDAPSAQLALKYFAWARGRRHDRPGLRHERHRRHRIHRRCRREFRRHPPGGRRPLGLAGHQAGPRTQRPSRAAHLQRRQPHRRIRDPHERRTDHRPAHTGTGASTMSAHLPLAGKRGLVTGIANADSIAWGCAKAFRAMGAELAVTYLNDKALPHVEPLARQVDASLLMPLNLLNESELEAVFDRVTQAWGGLDFVLHSIAFAPRDDLHGRVTDCSRAGFLQAMDVSCWSFIRMAKLAEPLMPQGGALFCMSYYGSQMVVEHYNMMGPVKAALESATRYLAAELGPQGIRVHAISPGPLKTRAASGIAEFDALLDRAQSKAPARSLVSIDDVGEATAWLATDAARLMTGQTLYIDGGYHIID